MPLQSSGQISLSNIITEFLGGNKLTDFYRGGAYVPNIAINNGVPTSGQIKITDFYGTCRALSVSISGDAIDSDFTPPYSTTSILTAAASGGSGTKSYSWTRQSGDIFTASGTTTDTVTLTKSSPGTSAEYTALYRCTVTDSSGSAYDEVQVTHTHGTPQ